MVIKWLFSLGVEIQILITVLKFWKKDAMSECSAVNGTSISSSSTQAQGIMWKKEQKRRQEPQDEESCSDILSFRQHMCCTHALGATVVTNRISSHFKILTWRKKGFWDFILSWVATAGWWLLLKNHYSLGDNSPF